MNTIKNLALLAGITLSLEACHSSSTHQQTGTTTIAADTTIADSTSKVQAKSNPAHLKPEEAAFIQQAAVGGMMEVELGNLTTQKTKSPKIKNFAQQMITDHNKANAELTSLATGLGIKLPGALPAKEQGDLASMRQMQANEYDQNYMDMMVQDHAKTIDLFNSASKFENSQLRSFAAKTLPVLQMHNKMAIGIDSVIKVKKPDNRGDDLPNVDKNHKN